MRILQRNDIIWMIFISSLLGNFYFCYIYLTNPECVARTSVKEKNRLCVYFRGGLGNHMFQYASVYGIAKTRHLKLGLSPAASLYNIFNISNYFLIGKQFCNSADKVVEKRPCAYDKGTVYFTKIKDRNYIHKSYLQSWKYFRHVEDEIRQQFVFSNEVQTRARKLIQSLITTGNRQNTTVVGVHIRRGDYKLKKNIKYGYNLATKEYIEKAMKYFRDRCNSVVFIVFTNPNKDDVKWCKQNVFGDGVIMAPNNTREVDMCALSMCNHTIMTVGSFGWWGSFLANGKTIYFKDVAKNGSSLRKDFSFDMSDYFYPGWIGMR